MDTEHGMYGSLDRWITELDGLDAMCVLSCVVSFVGL